MPTRSFDWSQFLEVSEELGKRPEESYLRTAIGRAYYYVFHLARKRLIENRFFIIQGGDSHKQVWEKFDTSPDSQCRRLAATAKYLKERRQRADYDASYPRIEDDIPIVIERAKKFAKELASLRPDLPRNLGVRV
jgi:uncharacterized protein (UPF0332 family)